MGQDGGAALDATAVGLAGGSDGVEGRYLAAANATVAGEYHVDVFVGGAAPEDAPHRLLVLPAPAHPLGTALQGFNSTPAAGT